MKRRSPPGGDDPPAKAARRRSIGLPDAELWEAVARTVEPLRRARARVPDRGPADWQEPAAPGRQGARQDGVSAPKREPTVAAKAPQHGGGPAVAPPRQAPPLADFDRKKARRLASGAVEIEARLDLHGLRQSEAHYRLIGFIRDCAARGLKTVLVITGKGSRRETAAKAPFDNLDARDHGVLRRSVPLWLAEPDVRALVVSYTTAGPRHGGSGALYVHLRRRRP